MSEYPQPQQCSSSLYVKVFLEFSDLSQIKNNSLSTGKIFVRSNIPCKGKSFLSLHHFLNQEKFAYAEYKRTSLNKAEIFF